MSDVPFSAPKGWSETVPYFANGYSKFTREVFHLLRSWSKCIYSIIFVRRFLSNWNPFPNIMQDRNWILWCNPVVQSFNCVKFGSGGSHKIIGIVWNPASKNCGLSDNVSMFWSKPLEATVNPTEPWLLMQQPFVVYHCMASNYGIFRLTHSVCQSFLNQAVSVVLGIMPAKHLFWIQVKPTWYSGNMYNLLWRLLYLPANPEGRFIFQDIINRLWFGDTFFH